MLLGGDEYGRTQQGNNNAYCQDDEISWLDWDLNKASEQLLSYTRGMIKLRNDHPVFRRPKFFQGRKIRGQDVKDIMWFNPGGTEMTDEEWNAGFVRCLGMLLSGKAIDVRDEQGEPIVDDTFLVLFNAHHGTQKFVLPGRVDVHWGLLVDTCEDTGFIEPVRHVPGRADAQAAGPFAVRAAAGRGRGKLGDDAVGKGKQICPQIKQIWQAPIKEKTMSRDEFAVYNHHPPLSLLPICGKSA